VRSTQRRKGATARR